MGAIARIETPSRALLVKLRHRQRLFLEAYVLDPLRNAAAAYRKAGYTCSTPQSAANAAGRLLSRVDMRAALAALEAEIEEQPVVTARTVIQQYTRIGFSDPRRLFDHETGRLLRMDQLGHDEAAAIHSIEIEQEETRRVGEGLDARIITERIVKVKLHDRIGALNALARIKGMFVDKVEVQGKVTLEATMARVNELQRARREQVAIDAEVVNAEG